MICAGSEHCRGHVRAGAGFTSTQPGWGPQLGCFDCIGTSVASRPAVAPLCCRPAAQLTPLWQEVLEPLAVTYVASHPNSGVVLQRLWPLNRDLLLRAMTALYQKDASNIARVLDACQVGALTVSPSCQLCLLCCDDCGPAQCRGVVHALSVGQELPCCLHQALLLPPSWPAASPFAVLSAGGGRRPTAAHAVRPPRASAGA